MHIKIKNNCVQNFWHLQSPNGFTYVIIKDFGPVHMSSIIPLKKDRFMIEVFKNCGLEIIQCSGFAPKK
jgi:hypothetical protein